MPLYTGSPGSIEGKHSDKIKAKILAAYQAGANTRTVATRFGVSQYSVQELARRAGILRNRGGFSVQTKPAGIHGVKMLARATRANPNRNRARTQRTAEARKQAAELLGTLEQNLPKNWRQHLAKSKLPIPRTRKDHDKRPHKSLQNGSLNEVVQQIDEVVAVIIANRIMKALEALRDN